MSTTMLRNYGWRVGLGAGLALLTACGADPVRPNDSVPTRLSLAVGSIQLASLGDSAVVRPQVYDQHGLVMAGVPMQWTLSTDGVLEPLGDGSFRAVGNGDVTIRATVNLGPTGVRPDGYWANALTATAKVRVEQRAVRLQVAPVDTAFTTINALRRLMVTVSDARGNPIRQLTESVQFRTTEPEIVNVDPTGGVWSRKLGVARVFASYGELGASVMFTVDPRLAHTACMVYAKRRRATQDCVTNGFTVHARSVQP